MRILCIKNPKHWVSRFGLSLVCLWLVFALQSGFSGSLPKPDSIWGAGFGAVLTDREKADLLRAPYAELEDHFGDVQYFKRYILSHPKRIA